LEIKQEEGGIGIVDIDCKLKALKAAWVTRIFNNKQSSLKSFFNSCILKKFIAPEYLIKTNKYSNHYPYSTVKFEVR
jgi:hypothetical protein